MASTLNEKRQSRIITEDELDGGHGVYIVSQKLSDNKNVEEDGSSGEELAPGLKTTADGKIVLIPQPSDDPADPLNWSWAKKNLVFLSILPGCFLTDWVITWGTTLFVAQVPTFHMSPPNIAHSMSGAIFMQGPGGLLAVPLCQRFGRLPVLFWSQFLTLVCTIGATYAHNYAGFTACRTLQGFFGAAPQVIGLSIIHDMFFFHERARKINIWGFSFLLGPYLGPFISGFIITKLDWRMTFAVLCGFYGFSTLCLIIFGDETLFDRSADRQPVNRKGVVNRIKLLTGIAGISESHNRPGVWEVTKDLFGLLLRPYLLLPTFGFVTWITMWTIGIVSTITLFLSPPPAGIGPYAFSPTAISLLFFAPMIGTLIAEFWGHWFNDFLCNRYIRTHGGKYKPENRLWGVYPAWIIGMLGLVILGETLQHKYHWTGLAFGWGMNCFSTLATTVAISAYLLDVFPQQAALAAAWINAFRTVGGFCVVWFQAQWVGKSGPAVSFGSQAAIVAFFIVSIIVSIIATQLKGESWRKRFPAPVGSRTS